MKSLSIGVLLYFFASMPLAAQKHPYLFFTSERLTVLKQRIKSDTSIASDWKYITEHADALLNKGNARDDIDFLSIAWLMTNDKRYAIKIEEVLVRLCSMKTWANTEMLQRNPPWTSDLETARNCKAVSIGFDAIYQELSKEDRKLIVDGVVRMGILPALNEWVLPGTRIHTLNSMGHNWWSACVDMAGQAALAILGDHPKAEEWADLVQAGSEEWLGFSGDELQFKPRTFDRDGGMYESFNYAQFGLSEYLFFRLAYQNTFPKKKQFVNEALGKMSAFFMQAGYPRHGPLYSLNFGDDEKEVSGERPVKLLQALGYTNPNNLWYLNQVENQQHREGLFPNTPIGITYQPDMRQAPVTPTLPTAALFKDMDWASMRNSWEKDATMLGVKSGFTWNHSHADANSFILFHKGEDIIKDAGNSSYATKEYPAYFFQTPGHNVVTFNGKAQPTEQQYNGSPLRGELSQLMDGGDIKYLLANAVGPTSKYFSRNFRSFIWIGKVILIVDDVKAHETGKFQWLLHPGGIAKKVGGDISIVNKKSSVLVRPLFPETLVQTGFDHDFPEKLKVTEVTAPKARDPQNPTETYLSIEYPQEVKQTKFITAIILKDSTSDTNLPVIERLHNETMNGMRITQGGKVTELYLNLLADGHIMHLNSINEFNGWNTDAYLFGFSYPLGTIDAGAETVSDYFMAYGSYVKKGNQTIFDALSKVYLIAKKSAGSLDMILQGQPLINARFYAERKPAAFMLNGKQSNVDWKDGSIRMRVANE